jgi:carbamoyl-phosphate synthase large subunit
VVLAGASARLSAEAGVHVVAADPAVLNYALDKWETYRFPATHELQHPGHARPKHSVEGERPLHDVGLPLLVKPRQGTGSRGMRLVASRNDIAFVQAEPGSLVLQEVLGRAANEVSATTWGCEDGSVRGPVSYPRGLISAGDTAVAEVRPDAEVDAGARLS